MTSVCSLVESWTLVMTLDLEEQSNVEQNVKTYKTKALSQAGHSTLLICNNGQRIDSADQFYI